MLWVAGDRWTGDTPRVDEPPPVVGSRRPGEVSIEETGVDTQRLAEGELLNQIYQVRRLLARGGMAEVYEGLNVLTGERVAIKVILPHLAEDALVEAMFLREARTLLRLGHPAVVQYRLAAREPSLKVLYIVTEFVDGHRSRPTDPQRSEGGRRYGSPSTLARRLAEGLRAAHDRGVFHRDLSPDNILLPDGRLDEAKIIDFGIAKDLDLSKPTIIGAGFAGKLNFVAPEQLGDFGRVVGPWTDIYSLGLVMLALVLGREVGYAPMVEAMDRRRAGVDLSGAPSELRDWLGTMIAPDPQHRYRSMDQVIAALNDIRPVVVEGRRRVAKTKARPKPEAAVAPLPEPVAEPAALQSPLEPAVARPAPAPPTRDAPPAPEQVEQPVQPPAPTGVAPIEHLETPGGRSAPWIWLIVGAIVIAGVVGDIVFFIASAAPASGAGGRHQARGRGHARARYRPAAPGSSRARPRRRRPCRRRPRRRPRPAPLAPQRSRAPVSKHPHRYSASSRSTPARPRSKRPRRRPRSRAAHRRARAARQRPQ